jgi:glycine cleavage system aminomethyltransferase T
MVTKEGLCMQDGLCIRISDDEFLAFHLSPYLDWAIEKGDYDIEMKDLTGDVFNYQLGGPRSLEIAEAVTGDNLHDITFAGHRVSSIDGMDVRVIRIGMAGTLAYEIHGEFKDAIAVYQAIREAGKPYGLKRLGRHAYWNVHTEAGFPQSGIHFFDAWDKDEEFITHLREIGGDFGRQGAELNGSMGSDIEARRFNPVELGWGHLVKFDHDFVGKEALRKIMDNPHREMRTLVWNPEDILDIWKSEFEQGEPYAILEGPEDYRPDGVFEYVQDKILKDGNFIGVSTGRMFSWKYRKMLSLGIINPEFAELGTEVAVLWGNPGTRQKEIRAIVSRFPYLCDNRCENVDVSTIPCGARK